MGFYDFTVCGNNIGALVSALELSKKHKVALINPAPNWGAHFAGIKINEEKFDIGMNFFEFTSFHDKSNDLMSYDVDIRNDSARFFDLVEDYITKRIDCVEVTDIEVLSNGLFQEDIVMANSLTILKSLPSKTKEKVKHELEAILSRDNNPFHASQKRLNASLYLKTNYNDVSIANHGETFHQLFIEPYCKKIFNLSSKQIPSLFHRIAWTPLFYPETLLEGLNGVDSLVPTKFHYPAAGVFSDIIDSIMKDIRSNNNITIITEKVTKISKSENYQIEFIDTKITAKQLIWCNDLKSLLDLSGVPLFEFTPEKASVSLGFCIVDSKNINRSFSSLYVSDMDTPIYRVTNLKHSAKIKSEEPVKLIIELNFDVANEFEIDSPEKLRSHINYFLANNQIISHKLDDESIVVKTVKNAINHPSLNNFNIFKKLFKITKDNLPNVELIGPASGFVSTSFNDQIIQGLKLGVKY